MGISIEIINKLGELYNKGIFKNTNSILEMGSQEAGGCSEVQMISFLKSIGKTKEDYQRGYKVIGGRAIKERVRKNCSFTGKLLYHWLDIKDYTCIDYDGRYKALKFNLNNNLEREYGFKKQFDLVTDFGNTEHIFNQGVNFENIHKATKENGLMIFSIPYRTNISHCFYMFNPEFFKLIAKTNKYEIIDFSLNCRKKGEEYKIIKYSDEVLSKLIEKNYEDIWYFIVMRKTNLNKFIPPFQDSSSKIFTNSKLREVMTKIGDIRI